MRFMKKLDENLGVARIVFRKYGIIGALRIFFSDVVFDYRKSVDTYSAVSKEELFEESHLEYSNRYVPSTFSVCYQLIDKIKNHMNDDFSDCGFIDFGSGKGKVLIAATKYPFSTIKGIEYSQDLHQIAHNNIQKLRLNNRVKLYRMDATEFYPDSTDRLLYFFNPFEGEMLRTCLKNICEVKADGARYLVCANPVDDEIFCTYFEKIDYGFLMPGRVQFSIYKG